jgi:hypothetical protein
VPLTRTVARAGCATAAVTTTLDVPTGTDTAYVVCDGEKLRLPGATVKLDRLASFHLHAPV